MFHLNPFSTSGGIAVLKGNLAPDGCVVKQSAVAPEMMVHEGPAQVFNSEEEAIETIYAGKFVAGDVVVIRYEGSRGGPGMHEMLNSPLPLLAWVWIRMWRSSRTAGSPALPAACPSTMCLRKLLPAAQPD